MGLIDSGATSTIIGKQGWEQLSLLNLTLKTGNIASCTIANGDQCSVLGMVTVPVSLENKVILIDMLVIPSLPHVLILGADFWRRMGIIPDLRNDRWFFAVDGVNEVETNDNNLYSLSEHQETLLKALYDELFADMPEDVGRTSLLKHRIITDSMPIKQKYYPVSPVVQKCIDEELDKMLREGIIEPSNSAWASPIILVTKADKKSYRFCIDYRRLNQVSQKDAYPLPRITTILDKLREARYLSTIDIKSAFWQIEMEENSKQYTAFTVPNRGLFQFRRMPFGLSNSPATWQRLIDQVIGNSLEPNVFVYLDDIVLVTDTFEKHISLLREIFRRIKVAGLTVSREKCVFCKPELRFLGYVINRFGLQTDSDKVRAILDLPRPKNVKEVRIVIGMTGWYRRFIDHYSTLVAPITNLLRKHNKFVWSDECEKSFSILKERLVHAPVLSCPNYDLPFTVQCDASGFGLGAVLSQSHPDGEKVVAYISRSLTRLERNFTVTERECLAVLWACDHLRSYLEGVPFTVITDHHALLWLRNLKDPRGRLVRWAVALQQYDFEIVHRKGKDHLVPDCLSRSVPVLDGVKVNDCENNFGDGWYAKQVRRVLDDPRKYVQWRVENGVLYKCIDVKYPELSDIEVDSWKQVVPKPQRSVLLSQAHDALTSGHFGTLKTFNKLSQRYYWPKM